MLTGQNLVTDLDDQLVALVIEPLAGMVRIGGSFLKNCVCDNHLARNEVLTNTEVLKGALGLSAPEPVGWDFDFSERVLLHSNISITHSVPPFLVNF
jgi:hypothetical protein